MSSLRTVARGLGQTLITLGVIVLLFCLYELRFTGIYATQQQHQLDRALLHEWVTPTPAPTASGQPAPAPLPGAGFARLYFPTLGPHEVHVVVEGVSHEDLKKGPGHYPGTDLPGQLGNVVISGHRTTYGAPFNRLDELAVGAPIVLETRTSWFVYRVRRLFVVKPSAVGVTYHVPDRPGAVPTERLLTLTTCNPKYSARTRLIVRAVLDATIPRVAGVLPPVLRGA